jgi:hypothetical protein
VPRIILETVLSISLLGMANAQSLPNLFPFPNGSACWKTQNTGGNYWASFILGASGEIWKVNEFCCDGGSRLRHIAQRYVSCIGRSAPE